MLQTIPYRLNGRLYKHNEIEHVLEMSLNDSMIVNTNKHTVLYNVPCSFDIETSSFYLPNDNSSQLEKVAIMYEWTLGINGVVLVGRTWEQFVTVIETISKTLRLNATRRRLVVYVHNLAFEFQFMRKWFEWDKVFSVDSRKPVYAITTNGIEFRCSYLLSGYNLQKLGEELQKYKVEKMSGDLDYNLIRHSETPLTEKEWKYCENDVRVVMSYIQECIENDGNISLIPLTKTGYVRKFCKKQCLYEGERRKSDEGKKAYWKYKNLMNALTLTPDEYRQAKRAFMGGFTHANIYHSCEVLENVASYDFTSSYPYCMVAEQFPMGRGQVIEIENASQLETALNLFCCMFDIEFDNIIAIKNYENYISLSRCYNIVEPLINNGRIVKAKLIGTTITEQDFAIIKQYYKWEKCRIYNFRIYKKDYLPTAFVKAILSLYKDKTVLKGVEGKEVEYLLSKGMLNSCYGMAVTDICRDEQTYIGETWGVTKADFDEQIAKYNKKFDRFLFYPWGVWVTAYARRNLFSGITAFGNDYVYSDTDSVKVLNYEAHTDYINQYNAVVKSKLEMACKYHDIPFSDVEPQTIKGEKKLLGVWDFEGVYTRFKTLGAKRYMVESDGKINITVSGVNKKNAVPWLIETFGGDVFMAFNNNLTIPAKHTGKLTHTYIDEERQGVVVDYLDNPYNFYEKSATHLEPAEYNLSLAQNYIEYLKGVRYHEE